MLNNKHAYVISCRQYKDKSGQLHSKHPVYDYYIGAMFMDQGGYAQLKAFAKERPPTEDEVWPRSPLFSRYACCCFSCSESCSAAAGLQCA
jgi:hypothetical protein